MLIFADPEQRCSGAEEKQRYETHENSIEQSGYVAFLERVLDPVLPNLRAGDRGLDYGCGPGPTLSALVRNKGIHCEDYDPFFFPTPPKPPYDFIFCTECFEHFHEPHRDITAISNLLSPGGWLGVMTERWTDLARFRHWYYTRDPTHTSFFHQHSMEHLAASHGLDITWMDRNRVVIFRKTCRAEAPEGSTTTKPIEAIEASKPNDPKHPPT